MNKNPVLPNKHSHIATTFGTTTPRIVLAIDGLAHASELKEFFAKQGFDVQTGRTSQEIRDLTTHSNTLAVVLASETNRLESGWLIGKKLLLQSPKLRVVFLGHRPSVKAERFADFLGATAYLSVASSAQTIARAAVGTELPSIN